MGVVSMADCETGAPVAVAASRRKEGTVGECEHPRGRKPVRDQDLTNALVCVDALHGQQETARAILDSNGEYLLQIKENQKTMLRNARAVHAARTPTDAKKSRVEPQPHRNVRHESLRAGRPGPARPVRRTHARQDMEEDRIPRGQAQGHDDGGRLMPRLVAAHRRTA